MIYVCACGREWTMSQPVPDLRDPVSSDEVVDVHQWLADHAASIDELLNLGR